jgi:hypothetical protein
MWLMIPLQSRFNFPFLVYKLNALTDTLIKGNKYSSWRAHVLESSDIETHFSHTLFVSFNVWFAVFFSILNYAENKLTHVSKYDSNKVNYDIYRTSSDISPQPYRQHLLALYK